MNAILLMFHLDVGAGYAVDSLLAAFVKMSEELVGGGENIHISFTRLNRHSQIKLIENVNQLVEYDPSSEDASKHELMMEYVNEHKIDVVLGFDQPVWQPGYKYLRRGGVHTIVSYWGAPIGDVNSGLKLLIKKLEVLLTPSSPNHYIFESNAMARTAYLGRGIPKDKVSIIYMGVDTDKYKPMSKVTGYAHRTFGIPSDQRIIYYSGHMEERKGVAVLMQAAQYLCDQCQRDDFHFLILGNRNGQEQQYVDMLRESNARNHVTFGGYRDDIDKILPSSYMGVIASTGWDSFTMSALEIAACGLPLLVSNLQGLVETIEEGETGYVFEPGNHKELAIKIATLIDDAKLTRLMGEKARLRILSRFTSQRQVSELTTLMKKVITD